MQFYVIYASVSLHVMCKVIMKLGVFTLIVLKNILNSKFRSITWKGIPSQGRFCSK